MDQNSVKNQDIKSKFVAREVNVNVNSMVEYILSKGWEDSEAPFCWDDVQNYYQYPEYIGKHISFYTGQENDYEEAKEELQTKIDELYDIEERTEEQEETLSEMEQEMEEFSNLETEPQEIFEWWSVSKWLCKKLKAMGEPVIEHENIWGRTTTGQSILLDYCISNICEDLEILEGQKYEWK